MSLTDELHKIIKQEAQDKAAENRLIDSVFPQPEPHVLVLDRVSIPKKSDVLAIPAAKPQ